MDKARVTYNATPILDQGDIAEISIIVDEINVRLLEFVNQEVEIEILCPSRFDPFLRDLNFAHSSTIRYVGETSYGVLYRVLMQE